jgi:hypothetical protein
MGTDLVNVEMSYEKFSSRVLLSRESLIKYKNRGHVEIIVYPHHGYGYSNESEFWFTYSCDDVIETVSRTTIYDVSFVDNRDSFMTN